MKAACEKRTFGVSLTILDTALPEQLNRRGARNSEACMKPAKIRKILTSALVAQKQPLLGC
ncbi:hypothetical protein E2N91_16945 [Pseudomonas syringae pv. tomato]|nr:hypothetical protein E2N91_16945 [Pseudomonas syringae pv. tomato]TES74454.1 hypothetical protein E2N89_24205 [Pseudomonas syringae pv. tomato]